MNETLKWYRALSWLNAGAYFIVALTLIFSPNQAISSLSFPYPDYDFWIQGSGMTLLVISVLVAKIAHQPCIYPRLNWTLIVSKIMVVIYWVFQINISEFSSSLYALLAFESITLVVLFFLLQYGNLNYNINRSNIKRFIFSPLRWLSHVYLHKTLRYTVFPITTLLIIALYILWFHLLKARPEINYESDEDQFKYGAIGLGIQSRIPLYIFKVLPEVFNEKLPKNGEPGYQSLGLIYEKDKELPVGLAKRHIGFESVEPNCAFCHTGSYKTSFDGDSKLILGGPAHELNLQAFQWFLYDCAADQRFNSDTLIKYIDKISDMSFVERIVYKSVIIPFAKSSLMQQGKAYAWQKERPLQGKGRTDTFNPTKFNVFHFSWDNTLGTVDLPQVWNQRPREGLYLHWDGNNNSLQERNYAAAMAVGATPESVIPSNFNRVTNFLLDLKPTKYPYPIDTNLALQGQPIFEKNCGTCHSFGKPQTGHVTALEEIGTDPYRLFSFDQHLVDRFHLFKKSPFIFQAYRKTYGYANTPLDGIWARAPYLHNGSIPSLEDLLRTPLERPRTFYKGYNLLSKKYVGFTSQGANAERIGFKLDVTIPGNGNQGHHYGTKLSESSKTALVEFMKTL